MRATYDRRRSRASELWVLIKYQTNTTAMMPSAVVTPCGSISAHAVSHVPPQTNCPGTQLLHSTPVYLHTCAALCARRVRARARECVCVCAWVAGHFTWVCARVRALVTWGVGATSLRTQKPDRLCSVRHHIARMCQPGKLQLRGRRSVAGEARWVGGHLEAPRPMIKNPQAWYIVLSCRFLSLSFSLSQPQVIHVCAHLGLCRQSGARCFVYTTKLPLPKAQRGVPKLRVA
jgi:hypothetical protein